MCLFLVSNVGGNVGKVSPCQDGKNGGKCLFIYSVTLGLQMRELNLLICIYTVNSGFQHKIKNKAEGVLMFFDVTDARTLYSLKIWLVEMSAKYNISRDLVLVVGTKIDITKKRQVSFQEAKVKNSLIINIYWKAFCNAEKLQYFEVSSKTGENIELPFAILVQALLHKYLKDPSRHVKQEIPNKCSFMYEPCFCYSIRT